MDKEYVARLWDVPPELIGDPVYESAHILRRGHNSKSLLPAVWMCSCDKWFTPTDSTMTDPDYETATELHEWHIRRTGEYEQKLPVL